MPILRRLTALEILDSRGRPTVNARCELDGGLAAEASVPAGASTGKAEALELRDRDSARYRGWGCRKAVAAINRELNAALADQSFAEQRALDQRLIELDGTPNKARLGANALLAVSLAFARAVALERRVPLYSHLAQILGSPLATLPRPTINLFSGGKHAGGQVPIQDVLVVPAAARTMDEALAVAFEVYQCAAELVLRQYGMRALKADEGGLAPPFPTAEAMLADAVAAIEAAGLAPGLEVALAVDVAASHFFQEDHYLWSGAALARGELVDRLEGWVRDYPIVSLEDGLAEEDWADWPQLVARLGNRVLVVGDDLLCTQPHRIQRAIESRAANALLLKVNQVGTLSEAATACRLAREAGWQVTISARSGETEDHWLADLAVGWRGDQIKIGSLTQSERLAKYNRLLAIEYQTQLPLVAWPGNPVAPN
ncbi:MAG: phosphopyruvate hydratase [Verrucomicrobia bacterium]|nr:phosphopyruvate hydratase [Verrucomicrobiota bacterium]